MRSFILCLCCLMVNFCFAEEMLVHVLLSKPDTKKATRAAIRHTSLEVIEKIIGPAKLKAQKKQILKLISTFYNRYIVKTKISAIQEISTKEKFTLPEMVSPSMICPELNSSSCSIPDDKNYFVLPVTIGFSELNLKKILLEEDLFYSAVFSQRILPVVFFDDSIKKMSEAWWMKTNKNFHPSLRLATEFFYNYIQDEMMPYGFYLINPNFSGSAYFLPKKLKFNRYKKRNIFKLAKFFQAPLVLTGLVKLYESNQKDILNVKVQLGIYHRDSGRLLAEVETIEKLTIPVNSSVHTLQMVPNLLKSNQHFIKGLGLQLKSLYATGEISAHLISITVNGYLTYRQFSRLQKQLVLQVDAINSLKEHLVRNRSITFQAQTNASVEKVVKSIKNSLFSEFNITVSRVRNQEIILSVLAKRRTK